jgi:L-alanine-DL-glutamate epimerase-like enolase superfamily enzyme
VQPTAERLRAALSALTVAVEDASCRCAEIALPGYPDGNRPTGVVTLAAGEVRGAGELVAFTVPEQRAFRDEVVPRVPRGRGRLDAFVAAVRTLTARPYERAALEAAAIDLALRQARTNCARLLAVEPRPARYVLSFGPTSDPLAAIAAAVAGDLEVKLDVDPRWDDRTLAALAASGRVAVLDWKGGGARDDHERVHAALPNALVEDPDPAGAPWSAGLRARLAADAAVASAADVEAAAAASAAVNLKPARMGGVLEALDAAARCAALGRDVYLGGMWEVGPGRQQLRVLAALVAPDAPNDIAPLTQAGTRPPRLRIDPAAVGFTGGVGA